MKYQHQELAKLWCRIKDHKNLFAGNYTGLTEVEFEMPIDEYKNRHREVVGDIESIVTTNISNALQILHSVNIKFHHLSCAVETGIKDNSALCIHYLNPKDDKFYALTIPCINYISTKETLA